MAEATHHLTEILGHFSTAMLATTDRCTNTLHARPMQILRVEPNGTLWFATAADSHKTEESPTPVLCTLQSGQTFVSLTGSMDVVRDADLASHLWKESSLRPWFPQGWQDPNFVLLRFRPSIGEYWDYSGVTRRLSLLMEEGRAFFTRSKAQPAKIGTHEKITVPFNANPIA